MRTRSIQEARRLIGVAALLLGPLVVAVDELALWSGQPSGDPSSSRVSDWYSTHATRVLAGDVLWTLACAALAVAFWRVAALLPPRAGRAIRIVGPAAAGALALAAVVAACLALGLSSDAATWWRGEGQAYRVGVVLTAASMVVVLVGSARTRPVAATAAAALAVLLVVPATSIIGLAGSFPLLAALLLTRRRVPTEPFPPRRATHGVATK